MRILFVAMPHSIHTARWIGQVVDQGWEIHLFPSLNFGLHDLLQGKVVFHRGLGAKMASVRQAAIYLLARWPYLRGSGHARRLLARLQSGPLAGLEAVVRKVKPDLVHSLEIQHAGYQTLACRQRLGDAFPPWAVTNWGSDVYLFARLAAHRERVRAVLSTCDYFASECHRDLALAQQLGLRGKPLPVLPCGGGFDLARLEGLRAPGPTSARRTILLKGYQNWAGRALAGLRAIELCADVLQGYRVVIQLPSPDVELAAELVAHSTGIPIEIAGHGNYDDALRRFGAARIHIGLSISDGISQSLLEAMVMGAFPIQSCTACANEWIEDGRSGFIVPPEDPQIIAAALRRAVTDAALVDQAAALNAATARTRLAYAHVRQQAVEMYQMIQSDAAARAGVNGGMRP